MALRKEEKKVIPDHSVNNASSDAFLVTWHHHGKGSLPINQKMDELIKRFECCNKLLLSDAKSLLPRALYI
jgi:hypothetical protein